jgi:integrase
VAIPKALERKEMSMSPKSKPKARDGGPAIPAQPNLNDVLLALKSHNGLSQSRVRDLCSSVKRVALLLGDEPARIPLDLPAISAQLAATSPAASGLTGKTFSNIRSNFLAAVRATGLKPVQRFAKAPLSAAWRRLMAELSARRAHIGLSRLAGYASSIGIEPAEVDDATIQAFITAVRGGTLHRKPNDLYRQVAQIWNEAAQQSGFGLRPVAVPSFRRPARRIEWLLLPARFRQDVENFLTWCAGRDPFAVNARSRALAARTISLRRNQIHAAATALVESGVKPSAIRSLADLVTANNFKRILGRRHELVGGQENVFNHYLAWALLQIARQWVKLRASVVAKLTLLARRVPMPPSGLTDKNKCALRQFDDPAVLRRLFNLPHRLWAEVKRDPRPDTRTLVKAQAALAVGILCYIPLRLQNLAALSFDIHLFLHEGPGAISTLELSADQVKNRIPMAFDLPSELAKMLVEYRNRIAPRIIGRRPDKLFVNVDGSLKTPWTVAWTIRTYLRKRAGIVMSSHQFRHLAAKLLLDAQPGSIETVRQFLGHKSDRTTVAAYTGMDSRRAGRHHQRLVEQALAAQSLKRRRRGSSS